MKYLAISFVLFLFIMSSTAQPDTVQVDCDLATEIIDDYGTRRLTRSGVSKTLSEILEPLLGDCFDEPNEGTTRTRSTASTQSTPFTPQAIRSLISRHAGSVKILDIVQRGNTTTIDYDLKPRFMMRNEWIAEGVVFKAICALQKGQGQIPHKLEFVGRSHFKSDVGRKFTAPSVEIHISSSNANRIVCNGNSSSDISWNRLSSLYKSYPIPAGASVDD